MMTNIEILSPTKTNVKRVNKGNGFLTIINTLKKGSGYRMVISKGLEDDLRLKNKFQMGINAEDNALILGNVLDPKKPFIQANRLKPGKEDSRLVVYSKEIVQKITEKLQLDFTQQTSCTFYGCRYVQDGDITVAIITKERR